MYISDIKAIIKDLPDNCEVEVNSIYEEGEYKPSEISEIHYDEKKNKLFISPGVLSVGDELGIVSMKILKKEGYVK